MVGYICLPVRNSISFFRCTGNLSLSLILHIYLFFYKPIFSIINLCGQMFDLINKNLDEIIASKTEIYQLLFRETSNLLN